METLKIKTYPRFSIRTIKTYKSIFFVSGLPKIAYQGYHISGGRKDSISKFMADDGQTINLNHHAFRFFGEILLESCILRPPVDKEQSRLTDFQHQ